MSAASTLSMLWRRLSSSAVTSFSVIGPPRPTLLDAGAVQHGASLVTGEPRLEGEAHLGELVSEHRVDSGVAPGAVRSRLVPAQDPFERGADAGDGSPRPGDERIR